MSKFEIKVTQKGVLGGVPFDFTIEGECKGRFDDIAKHLDWLISYFPGTAVEVTKIEEDD